MTDHSASLYLDLLKRTLLNWPYRKHEFSLSQGMLVPTGVTAQVNSTPESFRESGLDCPTIAHTMVGTKRLDNVQHCVETILKENIEGDLIETGVWRGGVCIFMRGILKAYQSQDRTVWVADSFEGLPAPSPEKYPADEGLNLHSIPELSISLEEVKSNFQSYGLLDQQVRFLRGWFSQTLPTAPIKKLALLRLDGDLYESTMDALTSLYDKVSAGGFVIVDDYSIDACKQAIEDFRGARGISDPIETIDWTGVYWRKSSSAAA